MHMADALLSPAVGAVMCGLSTAAIAYSVKKIKNDDLCEKKVPVIGVMGAFVFAAQMINFTIPATGSSGHIGGGILLAAMLGGFPAMLSMTAVLIIQCLFFADGGLLALGANIFNIGVVPCLIAYPLIFKPFIKKGVTFRRITAASIAAVIIGLQFGSFGVVIESRLSGITELPFSTFLLLMQPIHLAIGFVEGIVTAAILCFVYRIRPEIMESSFDGRAIKSGVPMKNIIILLAVVSVFVGGGLSLFASSHPDGLEWAIEKTAGTAELNAKDPVIEGAASVQEGIAVMPDYGFKEAEENAGLLPQQRLGTAVAGIVGGAVTFLLAGSAVFIISIIKKKQKDKNEKQYT